MGVEVIDNLEDGDGAVDIKYDGDHFVSVDAHGDDPPTIGVYDSENQEDAIAVYRFNDDGELVSIIE